MKRWGRLSKRENRGCPSGSERRPCCCGAAGVPAGAVAVPNHVDTVGRVDRVAGAAQRLVALDDPICRRKHVRCVAQQVVVDDMVVYGRANLASTDAPDKIPGDSWQQHLEAYRVGDYDAALAAGRLTIDAVRLATAGRRPAGSEEQRFV